MSNSEKLLKTISTLIENGILTSKDIKKEISTDLKFRKDKSLKKTSSKTRCNVKKNFKK
jgi:transposase